MKEVYYKGKPYQYKMTKTHGQRQFQLFENDVLKHSVTENELDVKSIVSMILDSYYKNVRPVENTSVLS